MSNGLTFEIRHVILQNFQGCYYNKAAATIRNITVIDLFINK